MAVTNLMEAFELEPDQLGSKLKTYGFEGYRGHQAFRALHQEWIDDWAEARQLPLDARAHLKQSLPLRWPSIAARHFSTDGTVRYLLRFGDGAEVESVYLPSESFDGEGSSKRFRTTFCISTQVGCPVNCQFCFTATLGLTRNLTAGEIISQVLLLLRERGLRPPRGLDRVNLVYMGMGEPFLNYEAVLRSVRLLTRRDGAGLAASRITISTSGIVEKIGRFGQETFDAGRPRLAVSLNASSDEQRDRLMPLNRGQGGLQALMAAARAYRLAPRERLTFEYVLLQGVNDTEADAERVAVLVGGLRCKINLIAWNGGPELPFATPAAERVQAFQSRLTAHKIPTYVRRPRGLDVYAACGQLRKAN